MKNWGEWKLKTSAPIPSTHSSRGSRIWGQRLGGDYIYIYIDSGKENGNYRGYRGYIGIMGRAGLKAEGVSGSGFASAWQSLFSRPWLSLSAWASGE